MNEECLVTFKTAEGGDERATILRLSRYQIAFELYNPQTVLRLSEVLTDFKITVRERTIYSGTAVICGMVNAGATLVCEARLDEAAFLISAFTPDKTRDHARAGFNDFLDQWQKCYQVQPDFKVVMADMQTFLMDLRLWLEQLELEIRSAPAGDRLEMEDQTVREIGKHMVPAFDAMHERLEAISEGIEPAFRPVHQNFSKRQLHQLVLSSPFAYRTYKKPLGYAGDYEMVNMISRDPFEGGSLFAKVLNLWFLSQWPARAHRNRIAQLKSSLEQEGLRAARKNSPLRVLNLGCGPAREIQSFLSESALSDRAEFTLLDFNDETIQHTSRVLEDIRRQHGRTTRISLVRKSVQQVLKEGSKPVVQGAGKQYDLIYCAGLFDYLSDKVCKQLMNIFFSQVAPDGLLLATNVDDCKPFRHMLEFVLDWNLIYRGTEDAAALLPTGVNLEKGGRILRDESAVNVFIEARKPGRD